MPLLREEAKKRQAHGKTAPGRTLPAKTPGASPGNRFNEIKGDTRTIAAKSVGVSDYSVQGALNVKTENPEELERIKRGEITVGDGVSGTPPEWDSGFPGGYE